MFLDTGFRRHDVRGGFSTYCEAAKNSGAVFILRDAIAVPSTAATEAFFQERTF